MKKPLIYENRDDYNDFINRYTPGKYDHSYGEYVQLDDQNLVQTEAKSSDEFLQIAITPDANHNVEVTTNQAPQAPAA